MEFWCCPANNGSDSDDMCNGFCRKGLESLLVNKPRKLGDDPPPPPEPSLGSLLDPALDSISIRARRMLA